MNARQTRAAVLGSPISHSLSPVLHRTAYAGLGLDWRYDAVEVDQRRLAPFMAALDDTWVGLSLTMPLKTVVLDLLDSASDLVWATGAANTAVHRDGSWYGENTDVAGIVAALDSIGAPVGRTLILGAGGTARAAVAACAQLGAPEVLVAARRPEAAEGIAQVGESLGLQISAVPWPTTTLADREEVPVVISTVPASATIGLLDLAPQRPGWLLDVTYDPWPSLLATSWQAAAGPAAGGAEMLVSQAALQVELFSGMRPDLAGMRAALDQALADRRS